MVFPPELQRLILGRSVGDDTPKTTPAGSTRDRLARLLAGIAAAEAKIATCEKSWTAARTPTAQPEAHAPCLPRMAVVWGTAEMTRYMVIPAARLFPLKLLAIS